MFGKREVYGIFTCVFASLVIAEYLHGASESLFYNWVLGMMIFAGLFIGELCESRKVITNAYKAKTKEEKARLKKGFDEAILRNDKPAAMKAYRHLKGCGLKEAKAHVESVLSNQPNN
ncbi:hypothetical protein BM525_21100 (plasmid) [Alteromonas mediterranea]|uniref:Ribosomal protein L7/L12 C-terminal domain-containing protein n=1 Tax=Alteromonas mediterranea TaxID=314275 RepID=A0AAC9NTL4_9ALTE|nr:hypothetical protein [Alteromonas mediterranea]APD92358.1 hypothetical protein BM524_20875 [Alteromonas mediterranea]APE00219.1 hypothetical protein BM525_21100 [Alteromonas mediterranea]